MVTQVVLGQQASSQVVLHGEVTDAESGEPLPGVNVFLSGTTMGSATDSTGRYEIRNISPGTYTLVASMVGYGTVSTQIEIKQDRSTIRRDFVLQQAPYELGEVRVEAERPEHWEDWFEAFRTQFIGSSDWAGRVRIANRYALSFEEESVGHGQIRLTASADRPLEIENRYLGYHVTFVLREFVADEKASRVRYDGYSYFEEMKPESDEQEARWTERREQTFLGSQQHFLWALTHGRLREEGFELRRGHPPREQGAQPYVAGRVTAEDILEPTDVSYVYRIGFESYLRLTYEIPGSGGFFTPPQKEVSWLKMSRPAGQVHVNGWLLPPMPVTFSGDIGRRRMAQRLPNEYADKTRGAGGTKGRLFPSGESGVAARPVASDSSARGRSPDARSAYELAFSPWTTAAGAPAGELATHAMHDGRWEEAIDRLSDYIDQEPADLTARYLRGIASRHLALSSSFRDIDFWNRGIEDLNWVLARDSTFRDALAQKALFSALTFPRSEIRWHDNIGLHEAIAMARRQLALRPDLPEARLALIRLYENLLREQGPADALDWLLRPGADALDRYFAAEALRREGRLHEADRMLAWLQERRSPEVPRVLLVLGRVRVAAARERPAAAHDHMTATIAAIETPLDAALLFEEVKYIVSPDELETYRSLRTPTEYRRFFEAFWTKRHPALGAPVNPRIAIHFQRLDEARERFAYRGPRGWHSTPMISHAGPLEMPGTYWLNDAFNDKGLIYLRHGPPDDRLSATGADMLPNESWRYNSPRMDFHFFKVNVQNNWRMSPGLGDIDPLYGSERSTDPEDEKRAPAGGGTGDDPRVESRSVWGGIYTRLRRGDWTAQDELARAAQEWAEKGLTTDQYRWPSDQKTMSAPYMVSAFRGASGMPEVVVDYALPIGRVTEALSAEPDSTGMESGVALYDSTWSVAAEKRRQGFLPTSADPTAAALDQFRFAVAPGEYRLGFYAKAPATSQVAAYREDYSVPDFSGGEPQMSDVVPAYSVRPVREGEEPDRNGFSIQANPTGVFRSDRPVSIYVEIYNLTLGGGDRTRYTIEFSLVPVEDSEGILDRILNRGDERVTLSVEKTIEGGTTAPTEYIELDVSNVEPGRYGIVVEVADEHTGQTIQKTRLIELIEDTD